MKKNYFIKNLNKSVLALSIVFCAIFAPSASAQRNISWTGATNNNWSTASNWNYSGFTSVATFTASVAATATAPAVDIVNITLTAPNSLIAIGDKVSGFGIPQGTVITAIDAAKTKITMSDKTFAGSGTPGVNVVFTFATPRVATSAPGVLDIAVIRNGGNPAIAAGNYTLSGLTVSNETGPITGSTLTIPSGVKITIETITNEGVLVKGGNIVNNGTLQIISSLSAGSTNNAGAYGMSFGLPAVLPSVATEYTYSGSGNLEIDTSLGNFNSGGILFNGINDNANIATYKLLFNGTTDFFLSTLTNPANGSANTHAMRFIGSTASRSCNVTIGGAGFTMGDEISGGVNGLMSIGGGGTVITIAPETTINVYSNNSNAMNIIGSYIFGTNSKSFLVNKGTLNFKGTIPRSTISLYTESNGLLEFENQGTLNVDMINTNANQAAILIVGFNFLQSPQKALVTVINKGTMNLKSLFSGVAGAGHAIFAGSASQTPGLNFDNSGTINITASAFSTGGRVFNGRNVGITDPIGSLLINSGTINTNQELRTFYTENTSTGTINFASTPAINPLKLITFNLVTYTNPPSTTLLSAPAATVGTTYTDENANVYTILVNKVSGTGTTLVASVDANIVNPSARAASVGPPAVLASALTKTGSGAGDDSIIFTGSTTNNDNAFFQTTLNSGTINTNSGIRSMTGINGVTTAASTSVLSPGGDTQKGRAVFGDSATDAINLLGTLKMQISGNTAAGVDYDFIRFPGQQDRIDISQATLNVTDIYTPTEATIIDIITTFDDTSVPYEDLSNKSGAIVSEGPFLSVVGITANSGWEVVYNALPGKVQLSYDPTKNLSVADNAFAKFKFNYYPNPTSNQLNLSSEKNISKVELFNILGQKVQSNTVNASQKQLNIANLQKGMYMMEVSIDNVKKTFKIVKQ